MVLRPLQLDRPSGVMVGTEALKGQIRFLQRRNGRLQYLTGIASRARLRCHSVDFLMWWAAVDLDVEYSPEAKMPLPGRIRIAPSQDRTRLESATLEKRQSQCESSADFTIHQRT